MKQSPQRPLLDEEPIYLVVRCQPGLPDWRIGGLFAAFNTYPGVLSVERFSDLSGLTMAELKARIKARAT